MKRWSVLAVILSTILVVLASGARVIRHDDSQEAPASFATPTLAQNPGSQSVSNGIPQPPNDTFAMDQAAFEEADGVDTGLGPYTTRAPARTAIRIP